MTYLNPNKIPKGTKNISYTDVDFIQDTIGNREDESFSGADHHPSVLGSLKALYYHLHDGAKVYPTLANATVITGGAGVWELGTKATVIPENAIDKWFDLHWIMVHSISANGQYEVVLYDGDDVELCRTAFVRTAAQSQEGNVAIQVRPLPPNTEVKAALASSSGSGDTASIKLYYHTYPDIDVS